MDPERWRSLYVAKLKACSRQADFSDAKKDPEYKDQKKEALIDLIDILDDAQNAPQHLFNENILKESLRFIENNIFRTFTNKGKLDLT